MCRSQNSPRHRRRRNRDTGRVAASSRETVAVMDVEAIDIDFGEHAQEIAFGVGFGSVV